MPLRPATATHARFSADNFCAIESNTGHDTTPLSEKRLLQPPPTHPELETQISAVLGCELGVDPTASAYLLGTASDRSFLARIVIFLPVSPLLTLGRLPHLALDLALDLASTWLAPAIARK